MTINYDQFIEWVFESVDLRPVKQFYTVAEAVKEMRYIGYTDISDEAALKEFMTIHFAKFVD